MANLSTLSAIKKTTSRGRPRKSEITRFKVMAWFDAVAEASGKTAADLEREFAPAAHIRWELGMEIRPKLWEKYRRGEVEPRSIPSKGRKTSIVQEVESRYPGTAKWLSLPLWKLADFNQTVTMDELRAVYQGMPLKIRGLIIKDDVLEGEIFWRKQTDEDELLRRLAAAGGLDGVTAILALVREAHVCQQETEFHSRVDALLAELEKTNNISVLTELGKQYFTTHLNRPGLRAEKGFQQDVTLVPRDCRRSCGLEE